MVRSHTKAKKARGDDAFTKKKQKTGRKKLAPVTDTRAEVHARSLFISTSATMTRAAQQQQPTSATPAASTSPLHHSSAVSLSKLSVKELLRGTSHYKAGQRASSYAALARILLLAEAQRQQQDRLAGSRRPPVMMANAKGEDTNKVEANVPLPARTDAAVVVVVEPIEKLRAFSAALEAMTDTDDAVRHAAVSVLQALCQQGWVCPPPTAHEGDTDHRHRYNTDRTSSSIHNHNQNSAGGAPSDDDVEVVWSQIAIARKRLQQQHPQQHGGGAGGARTLRRAPVAEALAVAQSSHSLHVLHHLQDWWRDHAVYPEMLAEDHTELASDPVAALLLAGWRIPRRGGGLATEDVTSSARTAADRVALENVCAILHTVFVCLTHAMQSVRWTGVELLETLLLLLQLQARDIVHGHRGSTWGGDTVFRRACREVCQRQQQLVGTDILSSTTASATATATATPALVENKSNLSSRPVVTAAEREASKAQAEERWMIQLLERVSQLVLRTPHVSVLPALLDAMLLSSRAAEAADEDSAASRPEGHSLEGGDMGQLLAALRTSSSSAAAATSLGGPSGLGSTSTQRRIATALEWRHAELVAQSLEGVLLSPWANAWKELMDKRLELLRDEALLGRAVALARGVGTVLAFLQVRQQSPGTTASAAMATAFNPRKLAKQRAVATQGLRDRMLDLFVRRVPITLATLLLRSAPPPAVAKTRTSASTSPHHQEEEEEEEEKEKKGGKRSRSPEADASASEEEEEAEQGAAPPQTPSTPPGGRPSRVPYTSPTQLRHRFALAQALALVAAPLASHDPEAWKLLHQYFTLLFPQGNGQTSSSPAAVGGGDDDAPFAASLEALAGAVDVLLLVLQLHQPPSPPAPLPSKGIWMSRRGPQAAAPPLQTEDTEEAMERRQRHHEEEKERHERRGEQYARVVHRALLFAPAVVRAVTLAIQQHAAATAAASASEERKNSSASGVEHGAGSPSAAALTPMEAGLIHVLLGVRQLLLVLQSITARIDTATPASLTYRSATSTSRSGASRATTGAAVEAWRSLHYVLHALPRLLFALRLQVRANETDKEEENLHAALQVVGPLPHHGLLVDAAVFAMLHVVWEMARRAHPVLALPAAEAAAVAALRSSSATAARGRGSTDSTEQQQQQQQQQQSCGDALCRALPSLRGFVTGSDLVCGVLRRCSPVTRRLAQSIAFYLGEVNVDFSAPLAPSKSDERSSDRSASFTAVLRRAAVQLAAVQCS